MSKRKQPPMIHDLVVTLLGTAPPIWRRIQVPSAVTLPGLHLIIQCAMGWENYHLHSFSIGGVLYETPDPDGVYPERGKDERRVRLKKIACHVSNELWYTYDFGDGWRHHIYVRAIGAPRTGETYPRCVAGGQACPPEDVGGLHGYEEYLAALASRRHPRHKELLQWRGPFHPDHFDVRAVNLELRRRFGAAQQCNAADRLRRPGSAGSPKVPSRM